MIILNGNWKEEIQESFDSESKEGLFSEKRCDFLAQIWHQSMMAFDTPREIQVVIDNEDNLFIDFGSASFVSFTNEEGLKGMKLPIKCWIHTHPFGQAYFSGTDRKTIDTWKPMMFSAIVLGDNQHQVWFQNSDKVIHYQYKKTTVKPYLSYKEMSIRNELWEEE